MDLKIYLFNSFKSDDIKNELVYSINQFQLYI